MKNYKFKVKDLKKKDKELKKLFKKCKKCNVLKLVNAFHKRKENTKDGYRKECKECRRTKTLKHKHICSYCNKEFLGTKSQKFCSVNCRAKFDGENMKGENNKQWKPKVKTNCSFCNKNIELKESEYTRYKNHYCSKECFKKHRSILYSGENHHNYGKEMTSIKGENHPNYNSIIFNCDYCGKESKMKASPYNKRKHHYCSTECMGKHRSILYSGENSPNYGKGDKTRGENNPNWKPRVVCSCDYCGEKLLLTESDYNNSKHHYCSIKCLAKHRTIIYSRENHPNWNDNLTDEEREKERNIEGYKEFINDVYKRDNYTCQCCGDNKGGNLNAHHIYGYSEYKELRTDINNGITLCEDCHKDYHKHYGYRNNNWKDFRTFLFYKWRDTNNLLYVKTIENIDLRLNYKNNKSA